MSTTITAATFTVTEPGSTTTIATPAGFQFPSPVPPPPAKKRDTLAVTHPERRRFPPQAIEQRSNNQNGVSNCRRGPDGKPTYSPARYPTSVVCDGLVEVLSTVTKTSTATKSTLTITAAAGEHYSHNSYIVLRIQPKIYSSCHYRELSDYPMTNIFLSGIHW